MADFANYNCGCPTNNIGCGYNQVINKCFVSDVPHYVNYNTHVVNNCIKKALYSTNLFNNRGN
ncbi:MAG: hypothetical protein L6U99_10475 [Clostridium sp.]|nr:MAG: hypothetical protein L6U99_10475 [Clostridium sp.]